MILVYGRNSSGKSQFSEDILRNLGGKNYYIATMIPYGEDGRERVKKHLKMREDLNAVTIEDPYLEKIDGIPAMANVIVEDISNLVANIHFDKKKDPFLLIDSFKGLNNTSKNLILVSIKGIEAQGYDEETEKYITILNSINQKLEEASDIIVEMIDRKPYILKGDLTEIL